MQASKSPFSNSRKLPPLPFPCNGSFDWLVATSTHEGHIGKRSSSKLSRQLQAVTKSASSNGLTLPAEFVRLIIGRDLHKHLRSVTDCYLDVARSVLPFAKGFLIRFLADSQGCVLWYLFLDKKRGDHCVVRSYEYFDADEMDHEIDEIKETDFGFEAESVEAFICRFWLENEILFSRYDGTPMPAVPAKLLKLYSQ